MIFFSNCKINLGLHVLDKRPDGFHNLETVFYPVGWKDAVEIIQADPLKNDEVQMHTTGISLNINSKENICYKAYYLLKKDFPNLPSVSIHLHKTIPSGAGLGGGSANGAFTLRLLNKKFHLGLTDELLLKYALLLGSDCPFFIKNKPCMATGRGENLKELELDLSGYKIIIVYPGIHVPTAWAFTQLNKKERKKSPASIIQQPVEAWKEHLVNDFEEPVFTLYPQIKMVKEKLYNAGALYASMSGSGSAVYGFFKIASTPQLDLPPQFLIKEC